MRARVLPIFSLDLCRANEPVLLQGSYKNTHHHKLERALNPVRSGEKLEFLSVIW